MTVTKNKTKIKKQVTRKKEKGTNQKEAVYAKVDILQFNSEIILEKLKALGVSYLEAQYSGAGDSGQVEWVEIYNKEKKIVSAEDVKVGVLVEKSVFDQEKETWTKVRELKSVPIKSAAEDLVYSWLESKHPGWENNDGGQGTMLLSVEKMSAQLFHTEFYTESTEYEYHI